MRLLLTSLCALFVTGVTSNLAHAQSVRVSQCCGHTKIVQTGSGFGYVGPVQSFGTIQTLGTIPVPVYGGVASFGFVPLQSFGTFPTFGGMPAPYGAPLGANAYGSQYGNPIGLLAAQFGIEFVAELLHQLKSSSQGGNTTNNTGAGEKPLQIPQSKNTTNPQAPATVGIDLSAIDQKLNALLTLQALNTAQSAKILETVSATDKKLDQALQHLNDIKANSEKNK